MCSKFLIYCKQNRLAFILAALASLLTLVANFSGVGWSWDSSDYVAVGKNFAHDLALLDATGIPMTVRPPGLSILIAIGEWLGLGINLTMQILNAVCAAAVVIATNHLLKVAKVKPAISVLATAFVAFSPALLWQYSMIWSEPPFIAVLLLTIIVSLRPPSKWKSLFLCALFVALFFIRYVGPVFAIAITCASVFFDRQKIGVIKSALSNIGTLAISFVPVWFWLVRNRGLDGTLTGVRTPGGGSLLVPLKTFTSTIGSWVTASPVEGGIYLSWDSYPANSKIIGVITVVAFIALLLSFLLASLNKQSLSKSFDVIVVCGFVLFVYVGFSAYRFVHWELGPLDNRMMIPVFVPIVLIVTIFMNKVNLGYKNLRIAFTVISALFISFQTISSLSDAINFGKSGRYWATQDFVDQPIHKFIKDLPAKSLLMSNQPQQLFSVWQESSVLNQYQLEAAQATNCENRFFVWYNSTYDDGTPNLEGQPEGGSILFSDASGNVLDLGNCSANINAYWP